jgi:hypothetical protein
MGKLKLKRGIAQPAASFLSSEHLWISSQVTVIIKPLAASKSQ